MGTTQSQAESEALANTLDEAAVSAARAEQYRQPDGLMVRRPPLADIMRARSEVRSESAAKKRKGLYLPIGFIDG